MDVAYRFAHHPKNHPEFADHVVTVSGMHFCRGCLLVSGGMMASPIFYWMWSLEIVHEISAGLVFYGIVLLQVLNRFFRSRHLSTVARVSLGFLLGAAAQLVILTDYNWVRLAVVGHYACLRCFPGLQQRHT